MKRKLVLALGLTALTATAAYAAGLWPNLPVVGGAAYCSGYSTGTSGQVCGPTVPAGPTVVTGLETVPADTNKPNGANPQTVRLTLASFNAMPFTYANLTPATASNALTTGNYGGLVIIGTGALSATTVTLPASPIDGQQFHLASTQNITSLTVNAGSATVSNSPTALTTSTVVPSGYLFKYRTTGTTWYRLQ